MLTVPVLILSLQIRIVGAQDIPTDPNFKVAITADTGPGADFLSVLDLIKRENVQLVIMPGDFAYSGSVTGWINSVNSKLGNNFPFLLAQGNHEYNTNTWGDMKIPCTGTANNYASFTRCRLDSMSVTANIDPTQKDRYSAVYKGLKMVFMSDVYKNTIGRDTNAAYLNQELANDNHIWKICLVHENMRATNVGTKGDEVGWAPFEACRANGAFIAQGHSHTYSRSKTLINMQSQTIDTSCADLNLTPDQDVCVSRGVSWFFDSSLGGYSKRTLHNTAHPYWAKYFNGQFGALFLTFNVDGNPNKAKGYFKAVDGQIVDNFIITRKGGEVPSNCGNGNIDSVEQCDATNLNGKTCATLGLGFTGGTLSCDSTCQFDTTGCIGINHKFYVKCKDTAGNSNSNDYMIDFNT